MNSEPLFKVGECAIYPAHGMTVVKRIDTREVSGNKKMFYVLQVLETQMTIMVPTEKAESVGLRGIISGNDAPKVYEILKMRDVRIDQTTWNRRYRDYMEKIKTGSVYEIAEVLRDLFLLRHSKDLSFGERKMLESARAMIVRELSLAQSTQENVVDQQIAQIFSDS